MTTPSTSGASVQARPIQVLFEPFENELTLSMITVAASYLNLSVGPTVALGLTIAAVKAALVAAFFMHLRHERAIIFARCRDGCWLSPSYVHLWTGPTTPGDAIAAPFGVTATTTRAEALMSCPVCFGGEDAVV
jgi:caa(3)-type oxidase subunit IV